jgi:hypothetical protein
VCGEAHAACGPGDPGVRAVDVIDQEDRAVGSVNVYDVGGLPDGSGGVYAPDTRLRLKDATAERLGLKEKRPKRGARAAADETPAEVEPKAKPRRAPGTRKRPAPSKRG